MSCLQNPTSTYGSKQRVRGVECFLHITGSISIWRNDMHLKQTPRFKIGHKAGPILVAHTLLAMTDHFLIAKISCSVHLEVLDPAMVIPSESHKPLTSQSLNSISIQSNSLIILFIQVPFCTRWYIHRKKTTKTLL